MGIIIGIIVIGILVFVGVNCILCFSDNNISKEVSIHSYDESGSDVDNSVVKTNTLTIDKNGRKTVVIYPFKDCKEGITISWNSKEN